MCAKTFAKRLSVIRCACIGQLIFVGRRYLAGTRVIRRIGVSVHIGKRRCPVLQCRIRQPHFVFGAHGRRFVGFDRIFQIGQKRIVPNHFAHRGNKNAFEGAGRRLRIRVESFNLCDGIEVENDAARSGALRNEYVEHFAPQTELTLHVNARRSRIAER